MSEDAWALPAAAAPDASLRRHAKEVLDAFSTGATMPHEFALLGELNDQLRRGATGPQVAPLLAQLSVEGYLRGAVTLLADAVLQQPRADIALLLARELTDALNPQLGLAIARATLMLDEVATSEFDRDGAYVAAHLLLGEQLEAFGSPHDAVRHYEAVLATDVAHRRAMSGWSRCNRALGATGDLDIGRRIGLSMLEGIDEFETEADLGTDRYDVGRPLGRGRHAVVFQARDRHVGRDVAIKRLLHDGARRDGIPSRVLERRFFREARTLAQVRSPYVVGLYDAQPERRFIAMELCRGGSLRLALRRGLVDAGALERIHGQLRAALDAVHQSGAIHRDVKPANILLRDAAGERPIALADFGLAMTSQTDTPHARAGTLRYMAPELRASRRPTPTPASDRFAAGVVLLEIALAPAPLPGALDRISTEFDPAALVPASVPDGWRERLRSLLHEDPAKRGW